MQDKFILIPCAMLGNLPSYADKWKMGFSTEMLTLLQKMPAGVHLFTVSPRHRKDFSTQNCWNKFPLILSLSSPPPSSSVLQGCDINLEISYKVFSWCMINISEIFVVLTGMVLAYLILGNLLILIMSFNI